MSPLGSCKVCVADNFVASASYLNPLNWVRDKLAPGHKEQQSKEEIEATKKKAAAEGQTSIFDSVASTAREVSKRKAADVLKRPKKPKPTSVGLTTQPSVIVLKNFVAQILDCQVQNFSSQTEPAREADFREAYRLRDTPNAV